MASRSLFTTNASSQNALTTYKADLGRLIDRAAATDSKEVGLNTRQKNTNNLRDILTKEPELQKKIKTLGKDIKGSVSAISYPAYNLSHLKPAKATMSEPDRLED